MITEEIKAFVAQQNLGYVATICPDGTTNLSPKATIRVWDSEHVVFADLRSTETVNNLHRNPAVEVNVVNIFTRKGFRFKGKGTVLRKGILFDQIVAFYRNTGLKNPIQNIVKIKVEKLRPLISPAYDDGIGEAEIKADFIAYWKKTK